MPHCSSEHEELFENMAGGAAAFKRAKSAPLQSSQQQQQHHQQQQQQSQNNTASVNPDEEFVDILNKIAYFRSKIVGNVQACGHASLCVYTNKGEWVSLDYFNTHYRDAADQVNEDDLMKAIEDLKGKSIPFKVEKPIMDVLASIILDSPNSSPNPSQNVSNKCRTIFSNVSKTTLNITTSLVAGLLNHYELENLDGLLGNMVEKWQDSVRTIIDKLAKLNIRGLLFGSTKNIIQLLIQTKLFEVAYQVIDLLRCNMKNAYIRIFAGYAMSLLMARIIKETIKKLTPDDTNIQKLGDTMDNMVISINKDIETIVDNLDKNLPAKHFIDNIGKLRKTIQQGKTNNLVNDAYIDAADNLCKGLQETLSKIDKLSEDTVSKKEFDKIRTILEGLVKSNIVIKPNSQALRAAELRAEELRAEELRAAAAKLREAADQEKHLQAEALEAEALAAELRAAELRAAEALAAELRAAAAEELEANQQKGKQGKRPRESETPQKSNQEIKKRRIGGGGAPRHTKKVKSKMLKGKSKKHLKNSKKSKKTCKKSKKTCKKVIFHSLSKKSKKNTRKRR